MEYRIIKNYDDSYIWQYKYKYIPYWIIDRKPIPEPHEHIYLYNYAIDRLSELKKEGILKKIYNLIK